MKMQSRSHRRALRAMIEAVEPRLLMSTNSWKAATSGDWDTAANWSLGHVPTSSEDASITIAGTYSVTHSLGNVDSVHSITSSKPFTLSAGSLNVTTTITTTNVFSFRGGEIFHATLTAGSGGSFALSGTESIDNVTLGSDLTVPGGTQLYIYDALNLNGHNLNLVKNDTAGYAYVFPEDSSAGGASLTGTGHVNFNGTSASGYLDYLYSYESAHQFTIGSGVTVAGGGGGIYSVYPSPGGVVNQGIVSANVSGQTITISGNTFINKGTMSATSGGILTVAAGWSNTGTISETSSTLNLGGTFSTPGTVNSSGGSVNLTGVYDLAGKTQAFTSTTGSWNLKGGTLKNGAYSSAGGAALLLPTGSTGTVDNLTLGADLAVPGGYQLYLYDALNLNGHNLNLVKNDTGGYAYVFPEDSSTGGASLTGTGHVNFNGSSASSYLDYLYSYESAHQFTIGSGVTVSGGGGAIYSVYSSPGGVVNQGIINANVSGQIITISGNTFINKGTLTATSGGILTIAAVWSSTGTINETSSTLNLGGTFSSPGTTTSSGGAVNLTGVYDLAGKTQAFTAATGSWNLKSGTLKNGAYTATGVAGLLLPSGNSGTLDKLTLGADLTVPGGSQLTIYDAVNLNGHNLNLVKNDAGGYAYVFLQDSATGGASLTGTGHVNFNGSSASGYLDYLYSYESAHQFTIGSGITISGGGGSIYAVYASPGGVVNQGIINANVSGQILSVTGNTFINKGTMSATGGGILTLGSTGWSNTGTISETSSTLNLGGTFSAGGTINGSGGSVNLTGVYDLATKTLAFTATTGSWNLRGGTLKNGAFSSAGGATLLLPASATGTLDNITLGADITVPGGGQLTLEDVINLNGHNLNLVKNDTGGYAYVFLQDSATGGGSLTGTGQVNFNGTSSSGYLDYFYSYESAHQFSIGTSVTITGSGGTIYDVYPSPGGILNRGIINVAASSKNFAIGGNSGFVNKGLISVAAGATLTATGLTGGLQNGSGGTLTGNGTITGPVTNAGVIAAGLPFGNFTINGALTQTASGSIKVQLGGTASSSYNKLVVTGAATLAGLLDVYLLNGFTPASGNSFTVFSYASKTGTLSTDGTNLASGMVLTPTFGSTSTSLKDGAAPTDTTAPTETAFSKGSVTKGASSFTFNVTYADNLAINVSTLVGANVKLTGPNNFSATGTLVSLSKTNNGTPRTAFYKVTPPGGTWDSADNGTYNIILNGSSVKDTHGNAVAGKTLGTFSVSLASPAPATTTTAASPAPITTTSATTTTAPSQSLFADTVITSDYTGRKHKNEED